VDVAVRERETRGQVRRERKTFGRESVRVAVEVLVSLPLVIKFAPAAAVDRMKLCGERREVADIAGPLKVPILD
jgi:hypothetical protein